MKKLFIALPLVAGVAVAGTSHYAGTQTENEYEKLLKQLNNLSPFVFVNDTYESGLGSSTAITKVMTGSDAEAEVLFRLHHDIQHASVRMNGDGLKLGTVTIDTTLQDKDELPADVLAALTNDTAMNLKTDVRFDGQMTNSLEISGMEITEKGETVTWSGITLDTVTQGNSTAGSGSMGSISYSDANVGGTASVEDSQFAIDVQNQGDNIYTGTGDVTFNNISVMNPATMPEPLTIESIIFDTSTDREGGSINGLSSFNINGIAAPVPLKNASLNVEVDGILMEGLRQYNAFFEAISSGSQVVMVDEELRAKFIGAVRAMVKPGTAMKLALVLDNNEGDAGADVRIGVKEATADGMSADALDNILTGRDLLNVLAVNGQLDADTAALEQTPVMMMLGSAGEFVTVSDESITSSVELKGTTLVVNGVELPLDTMSGGMLDVPFSDLLQ